MKATVTIIFSLAIVVLLSCGGLASVKARELRPQGVSSGSTIDSKLANVADSAQAKMPVINFAGQSSDTNAVLRFACDPRNQGIHQYEGGSIAHCKKKDLEIAETDSARVELKPGAARTPHWHDAWELQTMIAGKANTYVIDNKGQVHVESLTQGMVAFIPAGRTHWSKSIGDQAAVFMLSFPTGYKTFEFSDSLAQVEKSGINIDALGNDPGRATGKDPILMLNR